MSYYCKNCGHQSMNEEFEDNICDVCWEEVNQKTLWGLGCKISKGFKDLILQVFKILKVEKILSWFENKSNKIVYRDHDEKRSKWDY